MIKSEDIVFIINPNSGKQKINRILHSIVELDANIDYFVSHSKEAFDKFLKANLHTYQVFVICGGDGTMNSSLKYLKLRKDMTLAVLPNGSGDGFANELGFNRDVEKLLRLIQLGKTEKVDLLEVNDGYCCNMLGVGLDSQVISRFEKSGRRGLLSYIYHTFKAILSFKSIEAQIQINDNIIDGKFQMINVANTRQFGNNAFIAPHAKYNDGLLDLVLVKPLPIYLMPLYIFRLFTGSLSPSKYVKFIQTSHLTISSNAETYHIDGESRLMPEKLQININQQFNIIKTQ